MKASPGDVIRVERGQHEAVVGLVLVVDSVTDDRVNGYFTDYYKVKSWVQVKHADYVVIAKAVIHGI